MTSHRAAVLLLSLALLIQTFVCDESTGVRPQNPCAGEELNLHVTGSLNATGQPHVQARLEQPASSEPRRLEVRVRDEPCGRDGALRRVMNVVVHGPHSGESLPTPERLQQQPNPRLNTVETIVTSNSTSQVSASDGQSSVSPVQSADTPSLYSGYTKVANIGRYKVHVERVNWTRAALVCSREGATLAVPSSQREADALWQLKRSARAPQPADPQPRNFLGVAVMGLERMTYLVGVRRYPGAQNFTTIFGDELADTGFSTWATEPSNEEHCGTMFSNTGLRAVSCDTELPFICELPL